MNTSFAGFVSINGKNYPYTFSDYTLVIEGDFSMYFNSGRKLWDQIDGTITNEPCVVSFYLKSIRNISVKSRGYSSTSIRIPVRFFVVLEHEYNDKDVMLKFNNSSFSKWLGLVPKHTVQQKEHCFEDTVVYQRELELQATVFSIGNKQFKMLPTADFFYSNVSFSYSPSLTVKCFNSIGLSDLFSVASTIIDLVRFCFFRKLVDVGEIEIWCKDEEIEEIGFRKVGCLKINYKKKEIEPIELNSSIDFGFIPWSLIYCHVPSLMGLINNNDIYLDHLPEQRLDRFIVSSQSLALDAAAFEYEFHRRFPEYQTEKKIDKNYIVLRDKLEEIELPKECKGLLKGFISTFFDQAALKEKAAHSIKTYHPLLKPFFKKIGLKEIDIQKLAKDFKENRNLVDHGSTNLRITSDIANAFLVIRASVICMQLERIGMNKEQIENAVKLLFDCVYY